MLCNKYILFKTETRGCLIKSCLNNYAKNWRVHLKVHYRNKLLKKYNSIPVPAKATIWFMFCNIVQKCISLITTPIFTRLMTESQYGQYSIYNSWGQIFTIITTFRLNYAVFNKGMSKYKNDRDAYTSTMQSVTSIITITLFIVYLIFHNYVNSFVELPTFIMVAMFAELLVTPAIDFWTLRKRYEYIYKPVVVRTLIMAGLNASLGVVAVLLTEEKGYARILSGIFVNVCFGSILFVYNLNKGKKLLVWEYAKFAILFNLPLLLHYFSQYVLDQFDKIMIQKMVSMAAAGVYSVAYNAGLIIKIVTTSVNNALVPWQYDTLEKKDLKKLDDTMFMVFIFVAGCTLAFTAFAPELMKLLAGRKYYEAVYVIPPVALGIFFLYMYTSFANVEFFYSKTKFTMYISMFGALLNIVLNYVGIKLFGYIAAAYTTLLCYVVFSVSHYIYMTISVKKETGGCNVFSTKRLVVLSLVVLTGGTIVIYLYDKMIIRYIIILVLGLFAFYKKQFIIDSMKAIKKKK